MSHIALTLTSQAQQLHRPVFGMTQEASTFHLRSALGREGEGCQGPRCLTGNWQQPHSDDEPEGNDELLERIGRLEVARAHPHPRDGLTPILLLEDACDGPQEGSAETRLIQLEVPNQDEGE